MIKNVLTLAHNKGLLFLGGLFLATMLVIAPVQAASALPSTPPAHTFGATCTDVRSADDKKGTVDGNQCIYQKYVNPLIRFVSAIAGLTAVISIVAAGIQYSMAGGDMNKVSAAKKRITQSVIAFLAFIFLLAFLQWIVPGGLTGRG